jgi:hypothetical protein
MAQTLDDRAAFDAAIVSIKAAGGAKPLAVGIFDAIVASYALTHEVEVGWFRGVIDQGAYVADLEALIDAALKGEDVEAQIEALGDRVVADLKDAVEAAGLVDTGRLRDAITKRRGDV